jgi:hypothetical protein
MSSPLSGLFTAHNVGLGIGLSASSFFFWGNIGLIRMGAMKLIKPGLRERLGIRPEQALQLWEVNYDSGACVFVSRNHVVPGTEKIIRSIHFGPSTLVAAASFLAAAYYSRESDLPRTLLSVASGLHFIIGPFTILFSAFFCQSYDVLYHNEPSPQLRQQTNA